MPDTQQLTVLFSDIVSFTELTDELGDAAASKLVNRVLEMQKHAIEETYGGRVMKFIGDSVFAVFDASSKAMSCALDIQHTLHKWRVEGGDSEPRLRIGLHVGEVLLEVDKRLEIVSRHINRAARVMAAADADQILTSRAVVEAGKEFIEGVTGEHLAIRLYGERYLKGVGAIELCEIADRRIRKPQAPMSLESERSDKALISRLELAGFKSFERVGEGTFGVVFRAKSNVDDRTVALKVLSPGCAGDPKAARRFAREAEQLKVLDVGGLNKLLEDHLDHDPPFIVMQFVEGKSLTQALEEADTNRIARVFRDVCLSLVHAHKAGVVHCDLKPSNILIGKDDSPVVLDFGLSRLAADKSSESKPSSSAPLGTPIYMAPEQLRSEDLGPHTDVYALGVILYETLTGAPPFIGSSVHQIADGHLYEDPVLPMLAVRDVHDGLQRICLKALEKEPDDRYGGTGEMVDEFDRVIRGEIVRTRPSLYDNLILHRARQHIEHVRAWRCQGVINVEEEHRILSSYQGLLRQGMSAVMEGRRMRFWQILVYLSGWIVINGVAAWLLHWEELSRFERLALGSFPALVGFAVAISMWQRELFRLMFVALVVAITAFPLMIGVWLFELEIPAYNMDENLDEPTYEVFAGTGADIGLTNWQILAASGMTLMLAGTAMWFTGTIIISAQFALSSFFLYASALLVLGFLPRYVEEDWATVSMLFVPLLVGSAAISIWLVRHPRRHPQAEPWFYLTAILLIGICYLVGFFGPYEWWGQAVGEILSETGAEYEVIQRHNDVVEALAWLFATLTGAILVAVGLATRRQLKHRGRLPTFAILASGLAGIIYGLLFLGVDDTWPEHWPRVRILAIEVPLTSVFLPILCAVIALWASLTQMRVFLIAGMIGLALSFYSLLAEYFQDEMRWPICLVIGGIVAFVVSLGWEIRRTRGSVLDDLELRTRL